MFCIKPTLNKIKILRVVLDKSFNVSSYLQWFDVEVQQKILSYYHYRDRQIAFTSQLLQKHALPACCDKPNLKIAYTRHHKPYISHDENLNIQFNIAHCYNHVVMAIYQGNDYYVGIDIEKIDNSINIEEMAALVFSKAERRLINNSAANFFKLWTKKEALIKAVGTGFATDFYQDTALNLEDFESNSNYFISTSLIGDYYLSVCLYKFV